MSRSGRRKAITTLFALGACGPFAARAKQPGLFAKLFGRGGARDGDAFEWLPTECAHERHPMQLVSGDLDCGADRIVNVPVNKIVNRGWGEIGSRRLVGEAPEGSTTTLRVVYATHKRIALSVESGANRMPLTRLRIKVASLS